MGRFYVPLGAVLSVSYTQLDVYKRQDDAFALGCLLVKHGKKFGPAAVEVSINGLALFRNFPNGTNQENGVWLAAKRNLVNAWGRSSYGSFLEAQEQGKTLTDWKMLPETEYALCGGGFPIRLKNGALIGTACVSGLPHELDHHCLLYTSRCV